jgi:hypothetical protein
MPNVYCIVCKKRFYAKPHWLKRGWGKYCSSTCQHQDSKNGKIVLCFMCGKKTYRQKRMLARSKSKKYFCSKSCQIKWRHKTHVGSKHGNWKYGEYAYRSIMLRKGSPRFCTLCTTKNLRILAVHHVDQNRKNNNIKNLCWLCHNCHFLVHHYKLENERLMVSIA